MHRTCEAGPLFRGSRYLRLLAAACLVGVLGLYVPLIATAQEEDSLEASELAEAQRKIADVESQLKGAQAEHASAEEAVREADARLAVVEAAVNQAAAALDRQELAVRKASERVRALEVQMHHQEELFATRAVDMYKRGAGVPFEAVLKAGSLADAMDRSAYVQAVSASDHANLEKITALRASIEAERKRLAEERDRLAGMKAEQERLLAKVAELRKDRALAEAAARARVEDLDHEHENLKADSQRIEERIRQREQERAAAAAAAAAADNWGDVDEIWWSPTSSSGIVSTAGYIWPVCSEVTSEYGRRWGRMHEGLDISAPEGTPIFAAKAGRVIEAGDDGGGYGLLTLIDHGDGVVTAYAHQDSQTVSVGQAVSQGQLIGYIGMTGSTTGPHLHFETRVHGAAVNPRRFLSGSC